MQRIISIFGLAGTLALPITAPGQWVPTFVTYTGSGTTTAWVQCASSPMQQVRIVQASASSDLASANMLFSSGTVPNTITKSNVLGTKIDVAYTNGFAVGDLVILEKATGTVTNAQITAFTGATNITFGFNIPATVPGDQIYKMSTPVKLWVGVVTNRVFSGEAIFVGNRGRPVQVLVNGTSACSLDAITARYE
jgi:hypothetical protein